MDIAEVCDRAEIRLLMDRYALAVDNCDWTAFRQLFTADCVCDYTEFDGPLGDLETTVAWLSKGLSRYAGLQHNMTTHYAEISGQTARAVTYFIAYHTTPDDSAREDRASEAMMVNGGWYYDRLVKQPDGWRISNRVDVATWIGLPLPPRLDPPPPWYGTMNHHKPVLRPE
jgi:hypothetical protein